MSSLFQSKYFGLQHLNLFNFILEEQDFHYLHTVNADADNCVLPNLSSLVLHAWTLVQSSSLSILFQNPWTKLREIRFEAEFDIPDDLRYERDLSKFITIINESKLPNLVALHLDRVVGDLNSLQEEKVPHLNSLTLYGYKTRKEILLKCLAKKVSTWKLEKLDISHNRDVGGTLFHILDKCNLPVLNSLILTDCRLSGYDLYCLGLANEKGTLPELKYLDISDNKSHGDRIRNVRITGNLSLLLRVPFRSLQGLILRNCGLIKDDLLSLAQGNAASRFPELKLLDISGNELGNSLKLITRDPKTDRKLSWRCVKCDDEYLSNDDDSNDT